MPSSSIQQVLLRVFVETNDEYMARESVARLVKLLGTYGQVHVRTLRQYWKIPKYFEILLAISGMSDGDAMYEGVKASLTDDWREVTPEPDRSEVWDYHECQSFALAEARWANIEIDHSLQAR